jgi:hypothetical protein
VDNEQRELLLKLWAGAFRDMKEDSRVVEDRGLFMERGIRRTVQIWVGYDEAHRLELEAESRAGMEG